MSGDIYYKTNTSSGGTPPPRKSSSDHSIAASAGKLIVGAAAVTAVAAGALVIGMIKGGAAIAKAGIRAYKKHREQEEKAENEMLARARESVRRRRATEIEATDRYKKQIRQLRPAKAPSADAKRAVQAAEQSRKLIKTEADRLDSELMKKLSQIDMSVPDVESVCVRMEAMTKKWENDRQRAIRNGISDLDMRLEMLIRSMEGVYNRIGTDDNGRELAEAALADAQCVLEGLCELPGVMTFSKAECSMLLEKLRRASQFLESGQYKLSFAEAKDLILQCKEVYTDTVARYESSVRQASELMLDLAALREAADTTEVSFEHKGETLTDDLYRFDPAWFDAVREELAAIFPMIHDGMTDIEISEAKNRIQQARNDYLTVYHHAWKRLLSSYNANDVADNAVLILKEQGYDIEDHAYECDSEGEPLHINFHNCLTDDRITLVIDADQLNNVQASLHQFASKSSSLPDENKQRYLGELIGKAIQEETGKKPAASCKTPHEYSKAHEQADIQAQKQKQNNG